MNGKNLLLFTETVGELVSSGIPVAAAVKAVSKMPGIGKNAATAAAEISENLSLGSSLSVSLEKTSALNFPAWYVSFAGLGEKSGNLAALFFHLKEILQKQSDDRNKFFSSLVYPAFVAASALCFGIFALCVLPDFGADFSGGGSGFEKKSVFSTLLPALIFLISCVSCVFFAMRKVFDGREVILAFKSLSVLTENSVPVVDALKNSFSFAEKNRNLENALFLSLEKLERGEDISESFSESFKISGFKNEPEILNLNLSICKMTGKNDGFSKTADFLEKRRNKRIEKFLSALNPALMLVTAVYLWLILKDIFLPVISGFGEI